MDPYLTDILGWGVILGLFLLAILISRFMFRRAVRQVIDILRKTDTLCSQRPKTPDELGLQTPTLLERLFKRRDYKPSALKALTKFGIVEFTSRGRVCLREEKVPDLFQCSK